MSPGVPRGHSKRGRLVRQLATSEETEHAIRSNHRIRIKTEEKANVIAVVLGDILEFRTNHLVARTKVLGWWFSMVV